MTAATSGKEQEAMARIYRIDVNPAECGRPRLVRAGIPAQAERHG